MSAGWIYFARFGADGPIKIGRGSNPCERVVSLAVGSPVPLVLLGAMRSEHMAVEEAALHEKLLAHRVRGEWFVAEAVMCEMQLLAHRILAPEDIHVESPQLHIRLWPEELELWKSVARDRGMSLTAWVCEALNAAVLPEDEVVGKGGDQRSRCRGSVASDVERETTRRLQEEARSRVTGRGRQIQIMLRLLRRLQMERLVEKLTSSAVSSDHLLKAEADKPVVNGTEALKS